MQSYIIYLVKLSCFRVTFLFAAIVILPYILSYIQLMIVKYWLNTNPVAMNDEYDSLKQKTVL